MTSTREDLAKWADEAARYFERRPTNGEDAAFWANVMNAENARKVACMLRADQAADPLITALSQIADHELRGASLAVSS